MKDDLYEYPLDAIITSDEWDHVRYQIGEEIKACDYKESGEFYSKRGFPFLRSFEFWIETRLIKAGFKKSIITNKKRLEATIKNLNCQGMGNAYLWTNKNLPYGFPAKVVKIDEDNKKLFWIKSDIEAALLALESIKTLKGLLIKNGAVNNEGVKIYLHTLEMTINLSRAGNISEKAIQGERQSIGQSKKGQKHRKVKGMTPEERETRNEGIRAAFKKWKKKENAFCIKYGGKHDLSPSAIRKIINS